MSALAELLSLSDERWRGLRSALDQTAPMLYPWFYADRVAERLSGELKDGKGVVRVLVNILNTYDRSYETSLDDFFTDLREELEDKEVDFSEGKWQVFSQNIRELVSTKSSLSLTAKAGALMFEHARIYHDARIITDLRPIFTSDVEQKPVAMVVAHNLRLEVHEPYDHKQIYIVMDQDDLIDLKDTIDRAIRKGRSLRAFLSDVGMASMGVKEEGES